MISATIQKRFITAVCSLLLGGFGILRAQNSCTDENCCFFDSECFCADSLAVGPQEPIKLPPVSFSPADTLTVEELEPETGSRPSRFALKVNGLYLLAAVPNIGAEFNLGKGWTLSADWMYAWWFNDAKHRYWQTYGGYLGLRRYFGKKAQGRPFTGHHAGIYGTALTYDFEWGGRGYQAARWGFGGGVEYGYSFSLSESFNLDLSLGIGYQDGEYKTYDPIDGHYVWQGTYLRNWYGPTKATASLVWIIGAKKKGGER